MSNIQVTGRMEQTPAEHVRRLELLIAEEQEKPLPNNVLIAALCDSIRLTRELSGGHCSYCLKHWCVGRACPECGRPVPTQELGTSQQVPRTGNEPTHGPECDKSIFTFSPDVACTCGKAK